MTDQITFTGRNTRDVRAFINADPARDPSESWFITRSAAGVVGGQAWAYVKANSVGPAWSNAVTAAVYDPRCGLWRPVRPGDTIRRSGTGYDVDWPDYTPRART